MTGHCREYVPAPMPPRYPRAPHHHLMRLIIAEAASFPHHPPLAHGDLYLAMATGFCFIWIFRHRQSFRHQITPDHQMSVLRTSLMQGWYRRR